MAYCYALCTSRSAFMLYNTTRIMSVVNASRNRTLPNPSRSPCGQHFLPARFSERRNKSTYTGRRTSFLTKVFKLADLKVTGADNDRDPRERLLSTLEADIWSPD